MFLQRDCRILVEGRMRLGSALGTFAPAALARGMKFDHRTGGTRREPSTFRSSWGDTSMFGRSGNRANLPNKLRESALNPTRSELSRVRGRAVALPRQGERID